jgi:hypothetical protein
MRTIMEQEEEERRTATVSKENRRHSTSNVFDALGTTKYVMAEREPITVPFQ